MKEEASAYLHKAEDLVVVCRDMAELKHNADAVGRAYYAVFHAAKAVLAELDIERKSHHAVWSAFGEKVVGPGHMKKEFHQMATKLFIRRMESDYYPLTETGEEDAKKALSFAMEFVGACRELLGKRGAPDF